MKPAAEQELPGDMPAPEFQRALEQMCAWVQRYRERVPELPVLAQVKPGDVLRALPQEPPHRGDPHERWLDDLDQVILPGITHWNHPGFLAYFANTGSGPGILGELACAALNANGMLWKTSPAVTELEQVVLRWLAKSLALPADWFAMFTDTASTSTLVALAAAREATGLRIREEGLAGKPQLVLYYSEEAHSSVDKAGLVLGIGERGLRRIPADEQFRMNVDVLQAAIREDLAAGRQPFAVVATIGTTSATAVDPVAEIAHVAREHNLWLHVDAAYAGSAAAAPEMRWAFAGCEQADSFVMNPHKWLFTPMDCSVLFTRRPAEFQRAFSLVAEYLRTGVTDTLDYMNYTFQLGRRFRALKLWFVFRYWGTEGIATVIRHHCGLAQEFAGWVDQNLQMERMAPAHFSVVCFRVRPRGISDEAELERINSAVLERVNSSGGTYLSHTKLKGRYCLRIAIGNLRTTREHVRRAFDLVCQAAGL
jgi:aromatic-L-amino-acid decarboxylase